MNDTICAISTAQGVGAIAIIRVSGEKAIPIVNKIFKGKNLENVKSHNIVYGHIVDNYENEIDEVLVTVMKAPKTYTTEDTVEINTHGGIAPTNKVLELLLLQGCRLAEPGEFTKRAFLNGRIDLLEAEAVMDKINAQTEKQNELANNGLNGKISKLIDDLRNDMIQIISNINVNIDYPEYDDVDIITNDLIIPKITNLKNRISKIIDESKNGLIIKDGITMSIIGEPNAGKSSLLNALIDENKAIVTDIAGTTRDIVEGKIIINGIPINIIDTAGIRETKDIIESIGVEKSKQMIEKSDLIILIINNNTEINNDIKDIYNRIKNKKHIIILNKIDLKNIAKIEEFKEEKIIKMSIKNNQGIEDLKKEIIDMFNLSQIELNDPTYLSNARSIAILKNCYTSIESIENSLKNNIPIDMIEIDIKHIWEELGKINGKYYDEELLDEMFKRFCLGK